MAKYTRAQILINQLGKKLFENNIWYDASIEYNKDISDELIKSWGYSDELTIDDLVETIRLDLDIAPSDKARGIIKEFLLNNKKSVKIS